MADNGFPNKAMTYERGQDMAEYALLIGMVALVVVVGAVFLGSQISDFFVSAGGWFVGLSDLIP